MQFSANVEKLKPSATIAVSTLAKKLAAEGRDIINLSAGEPDFDTPAFIAEAGTAAIREGRTRYTPTAGIPGLRVAIAERLSDRSGRAMDPDGVVVTTGAKQALFNAIFTLFGPGDEVLVAAPYWTTYPDLIKIARAEPIEVFGGQSNDFKVTPADLDQSVTDATRGLIINTPCNPTGAVYSEDELCALAEWCRERGVWLLSDEIYRHIYHEGEGAAPGILGLAPGTLGPHVLIDGASKSFAMTGWRIGFTYADTEVTKKFSALQSQITSNAATPSQFAALAAFTEKDSAGIALASMGQAFARRRDLVCRLMDDLLPGVPFIRPCGAFYLFFCVEGFFDEEITSATQWCSQLLQQQGVALVPGAAFGDDSWVRMSFASADEVIEEAFMRISSAVHKDASAQ